MNNDSVEQRNIKVLAQAIKDDRVGVDEMLTLLKNLQNTVALQQIELNSLKQNYTVLMAIVRGGGGPTSGN